MDKLYDVQGAAEKLGGISISTVRAWLSRGQLARTKVGRRTMISESELERFIRHGQRKRSPGGSEPRQINGSTSK